MESFPRGIYFPLIALGSASICFLDINVDDFPPLLTNILPWSKLNVDAAASTTKAGRFNVGDTESEWYELVLGLQEPWKDRILILNDF